MNEITYFDNSSTTRPLDEVLLLMQEINVNNFGNPSSLHLLGIEAEKKITEARKQIASPLSASPDEIYFTSGGTESNNIAILGYLSANRHNGNKVILSAIEHPSVLQQAGALKKIGYSVVLAGVDNNGLINLNKLDAILDENVVLVSIMHVNNEIGSIQPIGDIKNLLRKKAPNAAFHVDAVQSYCKIPVNPAKDGIDLLTGSSHKIHGPKGVGFIYINRSIRVEPLFCGGGQENGIKPGTENVPGVAGFGLAASIAEKSLDKSYENIKYLNEYLRGIISEKLPGAVFITKKGMFPYILNVSVPGSKAEVILHRLEAEGIYISVGSACSSRNKKRSHVLAALGLKPSIIDGALRISFSRFNTRDEVDKLAECLIKAAGRS